MALPADVLDRPAAEAARWLALEYLEKAAAAWQRLDDPEDLEALHDFRVGLRRLRSCLRAYRPHLEDGLPKGTRRRVKALMASTGPSRDAEVQLAWLRAQEATLTARQRVGLAWLLRALSDRKQQADAEAGQEVRQAFPRLRRKLAGGLSEYRVSLRLGGPAEREATASHATGSLLLDLAGDLEQHLAAVHSLGDVAETHQARIAGKRLRYLLEPLRRDIEAAGPLIGRLKHLQDTLGDLQDAAVLAEAITNAMVEAAGEQARRLSTAVLQDAEGQGAGARRRPRQNPRPGLLELARRLRERTEKAFAAFKAEWLGGAAGAFLADARELGHSLVNRGARALEIERKYLLSGRPDFPPGAPALRIDQGYLPGARITERLRRVRGPMGERWYRTVKVGSGLARLEHEEETTAEVFKRMWPLTRGRRVRKRRYEVPAGESVWQIDEFLDRDLVLAEIELPFRDAAVEPPEWLRPRLVREVTDDPEYQNVNLAR